MDQPTGAEGREPLSRSRVVAAALELIDAEGLETFSMRALARQLQVKPNALYWHVPDLDSLLALVAARLLDEVDLPGADLPWPERLRVSGRSYRAVVAAHPRCAALLTGRLTSNWSAAFPLVEAVLAAVRSAGVPDARVLDAYNGVVGALAGFVGVEFATAPASTAQWEESRRNDLRALDGDRFPAMAAVADHLDGALLTRWEPAPGRPLTTSFEWLLDVLVAGVGALAAPPGTAG